MASRHSRQPQHRVSSLGDALSTAARETRAPGPDMDRRVSHGAAAAASWLSPVGNRRSSTERLACVRPIPGDVNSMLGNRRSCNNHGTPSPLLRGPPRRKPRYVSYSVRLSICPAQKLTRIRSNI